MSLFVSDLRFAVRKLLRDRGFTAIAVLLLTLGIGATTAVFSVVDAVLLRPLPYPDSERLVNLWEINPPMMHGSVAVANYLDWKAQNGTLAHLAAFTVQSVNLTGQGTPERLRAALVAPDYFDTVGVGPALGRAFTADEAKGGNDRVAILNHDFWVTHFGARPDVIGSKLLLDGDPFTVIGVMPPNFEAPLLGTQPAVWVPFVFTPAQIAARGNHSVMVVGRLKPGVSVAQARADLTTIAARLAQQYPDTNRNRTVGLDTVHEQMVQHIRPSLVILLTAVAILLVVACANVASLLMARAMTRAGEVAVRLALGATRRVLIAQFLTESVVLGLVGGACGLVASLWAVDGLRAGLPGPLRQIASPEVRLPIVAFVIAIAVLTSIGFGLLPALQLSRGDLRHALSEAGARATGGKHRHRTRRALVIAELGLSITLVAGAALLVRSYLNLRNVQLGFDPSHVLTFELSLPPPPGAQSWADAQTEADLRQRSERLLQAIAQVPGVESVSASNYNPLSAGNTNGSYSVEGQPEVPDSEVTEYLPISPDYFKTLGIPLKAGRAFTAADSENGAPVAIVNEAMVRQAFPGGSAIGKRLRIDWGSNDWREVVGVVADIHRRGIDLDPVPETYLPLAQRPLSNLAFAVRTHGDPAALTNAVRGAVTSVDPNQPIAAIETMQHRVDSSVAQQRFDMFLITVFAVSALLLAVVGVYGVISFQITQRIRELAIRIALGAMERDIIGLIVGDGLKLTAFGLVVGLAGALAAARLLATVLFGVSPSDPLTLAGVAVLIAAVTLVASYLPARRAAQTQPMLLLRKE